MSKKKADDDPTFGESIDKLQSILTSMEGDETSLEDSLRLFEEGIALSRQAQAVLTLAEQRINTLIGKHFYLVDAAYSGANHDHIMVFHPNPL